MSRARGPIKYTCPAIDSAQNDMDQLQRSLGGMLDKFDGYTISDIKEAIKEAIDRISDTDKFLEEIRSSNDELRSWGAEMEDKACEVEDENIKLSSELEDAKSELADKCREIADLENELSNLQTA